MSIKEVHPLLKWDEKGKLMEKRVRSCACVGCGSTASGDGPGAAGGHQGQHLDRRAGLGAQEGQGEPERAGTSPPVTASNHDDIQE